MAKSWVNQTFAGIVKDAFYFHDFDGDVVDCDAFQRRDSTWRFVQCYDNKYLILNDIGQFYRKDLNSVQLESDSPDFQLNITYYRDLNTTDDKRGSAVILYARNEKNNEMYAAVCNGQNEVVAKPVQNIESYIQSNTHEAVFYMVEEPDVRGIFKLQSSLDPHKALGFDENDSKKLILRSYPDPNNQYDTIRLVKKQK